MLSVWSEFGVCAALIAVAGRRLSYYGDVIADKTGLSGNWIGMILLASVTSLPELVTGISAVTLADAPELAVGNVLGSCMVNLSMLAVIDFLHRRESFYRRASRAHILSAGFGIVSLAFVGIGILLGSMTPRAAVGHVSVQAIVIFVLYGVAIRTVLVFEREQIREFAADVADRYPDLSLGRAVRGYLLAAVVVVGAGLWLPFIGTRLADAMNWHGSFVGTLLMAAATTLPELAVTVSAIRIGALDMAIANLLGSNLFNVTILAVDDLFYLKGPIFTQITPVQAFSAFSGCLMTGLAVIGLTCRPGIRLLSTVGWISVCLIFVYVLNAWVLFHFGG